jgi:hypothetical protein
MNKNFISVAVNVIQQKPKPKQKTPSPAQSKPKITFEELQQERVSQFEQDLSARQQEFSSAMAIPLPPTPTFSDNKKDEAKPASEMEEMMRRAIAERNLDVEKIKQDSNAAKGTAETWLRGSSTSVKEETEAKKQAALAASPFASSSSASSSIFSVPNPKTIQIGNEEKHISWAEEEITYAAEKIPVPVHQSLFSKLKVKDPMEELKDLINKRFDKLEELLGGLRPLRGDVVASQVRACEAGSDPHPPPGQG